MKKSNKQLQKEHRQRLEEAGLERVEVWRPKGTRKQFQSEHCLKKTVTGK